MPIVFESFTATNSATIKAHRRPRVRLVDAANVVFGQVPHRVTLTGTMVNHGAISAPALRRARLSDTAGARFALHRTPHVLLAAATPVPSASIFVLNRAKSARLTGSQVNGATISGRVAHTVRLTDADGLFMLHKPRSVYLSDGHVSFDRTALLLQQPYLVATAVLGVRVQLDESMGLAGGLTVQQVMVRRALLGLAGHGSGLLDAIDAIGEALTFSDVAGIAWNVIYQSTLQLGDTGVPSVSMLVETAEALALAGEGATALDALNAVVAALALGDAAGFVWPSTLLEAIALAGAGGTGLASLDRETERLGLSGTAVGAAHFTMLAPEGLALGDAATSTAELVAQIRDGMRLLATINLPDGQYLAWVLNAGSNAYTSYKNFPFNSFCELGGKYYGATDTGLYLLEGDDDAGEPIAARIRSGLEDMGTGLLKRMDTMYLGYRASGDLVLKVVTTSEGGEKREDWYALEPRPAGEMREGRVKVGRGLKSRYWGFELANVDGADFELDSLAWLPMVLERRI